MEVHDQLRAPSHYPQWKSNPDSSIVQPSHYTGWTISAPCVLEPVSNAAPCPASKRTLVRRLQQAALSLLADQLLLNWTQRSLCRRGRGKKRRMDLGIEA
jgi:hypothetical protein